MTQVIYVLNQEVAFDLIAQVLLETDLQLTDVASCTFPSRPEPKSAIWIGKQQEKVIGYSYLPDIELRYLRLLDRSWTGFHPDANAPVSELFAGENTFSFFSTWDELTRDLHSGDHRKTTRAAWAMRAAAKHRDDSVDGEAQLLEALSSPNENVRKIAAEAIADVATSPNENTIRDFFDADDSADVRMHLRRAIDHIMSTL